MEPAETGAEDEREDIWAIVFICAVIVVALISMKLAAVLAVLALAGLFAREALRWWMARGAGPSYYS